MRRVQESPVLDDRRDVAFDHLLPDRRFAEAGEIAAHGQPEGLGVRPGDAERAKPIRDGDVWGLMQRAGR